MIALERFEKALSSTEPGQALRLLVQSLAAEGHQNAAIYETLERFLLHVQGREKKCEADEDRVLDVMDALSGWCHPAAQLLPER